MNFLSTILYHLLLKPLDAIGLLPLGVISPYPLYIKYYENGELRYSENVENPVDHLLEFAHYFDEGDFKINESWKIYFEYEDRIPRIKIEPEMFWSEARHSKSVQFVEAYKPVETIIGYISTSVPFYYYYEFKINAPYYFKNGWFRRRTNHMAEISDAVLRKAIDRPTWRDEVFSKVILNGKWPVKTKN